MKRIEVHVQGRNDDYEPHWAAKLEAMIVHNRALAQQAGIDLCFSFAEWNPPDDRPLISSDLCRRFPFVRAVVIAKSAHQSFGVPDKVKLIPQFATNSALRSCDADYFLITGGDVFFGREVISAMANVVQPRRLYRAQRVNVDADFDFLRASPGDIQDQAMVVSIDTCREPPYDEAPYTNASGDFILIDRATFVAFRGVDETIRETRLHLDSRCVLMPHLLGLTTTLLGDIFHISHSKSWVNLPTSVQSKAKFSYFNYTSDMPYINDDAWGLRDFRWTRHPDRILRVTAPDDVGVDDRLGRGGEIAPPNPMSSLSRADRIWATNLREQAIDLQKSIQPPVPPLHSSRLTSDIHLRLASAEQWTGAGVSRRDAEPDAVAVRTVESPWGYSASAEVPDGADLDQWRWLGLEVAVEAGSVAIGFLSDNDISGERIVSVADQRQTIWWMIPSDAAVLMIRNGEFVGASSLTIFSSVIATLQKSKRPQKRDVGGIRGLLQRLRGRA